MDAMKKLIEAAGLVSRAWHSVPTEDVPRPLANALREMSPGVIDAADAAMEAEKATNKTVFTDVTVGQYTIPKPAEHVAVESPPTDAQIVAALEEVCKRFRDWQDANHGGHSQCRKLALFDDANGWHIMDQSNALVRCGIDHDALFAALAERPTPKPPTLAEDWETVKACGGKIRSTSQNSAWDRVSEALVSAGAIPCALWRLYGRTAYGTEAERDAIAAIDEWIDGRDDD